MKYGPVGPKSRLALANSTATIELYEGAVRSGKTVTTLYDFARFCVHGPAGEFAMVGRTERTVFRNLIRPLQLIFGERRVVYNRGTGQLVVMGRLVWVIGANNEAAVSKIQGLTLAGLYLDEAATLPESFFNMATTRLSIPGAKMWATCNPEGAKHWLKTKWLDKAALWVTRDSRVIHSPQNTEQRVHRYTFTLDDNEYLDPAFVRRLKASYTGIWYRRFILSEWTNAEGAIFDMWDETRHVVPFDQLPRMIALPGAGLDYGTSNASAAGMLGWGEDNRLYITSEWRYDPKADRVSAGWTDAQMSEWRYDPKADKASSNWTDAQISASVIEWFGGRHTPAEPGYEPVPPWLFVDPAAASLKAQLHFDGFRKAANATNDVVPGLKLIASLFSTDRLRVADSCPGLIGEIPEYRWDPKATERGHDAPVKENDHSIDGALRYPVASTQAVWARRVLAPRAVDAA